MLALQERIKPYTKLTNVCALKYEKAETFGVYCSLQEEHRHSVFIQHDLFQSFHEFAGYKQNCYFVLKLTRFAHWYKWLNYN